jgi:hypothetical protein
MRVGKVAGRYTEKGHGAARCEVDSDHGCVLLCIDDEGPVVRTRYDGAAESPGRPARVVDPEFVRVQVDHQLEGTARQDALARVVWRVPQRPQILDEAAESTPRMMREVLHASPLIWHREASPPRLGLALAGD